VIERHGPWRSFEQVEFATLEWIEWYNSRRLMRRDFPTLGWLSDLHLGHADDASVQRFFHDVATTPVDAWLIGGDIGEASSSASFLRAIEASTSQHIYFVLGNHDFYGSSRSAIRHQIGSLTQKSPRLTWLTEAEPQILTSDVALVGDDSWADARFGDASGSLVELNDFHMIDELMELSREERISALNQLGDEAAARLAPKLARAAAICAHVIVLTHVPPFREAAWHMGRMSSDEYLPWFSCKAVGEAIMASADARPRCRFLVLCGHTHSSGSCTPAPNIRVLTAAAQYGSPHVQTISWPSSL